MSYQVNWEIGALNQAAGFLRDDPAGVAALWDSISGLAGQTMQTPAAQIRGTQACSTAT